jgi:3-hydroxyisobutyrate dehydrogenase-like beta-hydroxyacid dehydrogenase
MKISVIGTGLMCSAIAKGLIAADYDVTAQDGANAKAISASDATFLVLPDASSTRAVLESDGVQDALKGRYLLNVAATASEEITALADRVGEAGGNLAEVIVLACPDRVRMRHGEFILACDQTCTSLWRRVLGSLGEAIHHVGPVPNGFRASMSLQLSYMFHTIAVGYSVAAFQKQNLPINVAQHVLTSNRMLGIAGADRLVAAMKERTYPTRLETVNDMRQSCDLIIDFAKKLGLPTDALSAVRHLYETAAVRSFGTQDVSAVYEVIRSAD